MILPKQIDINKAKTQEREAQIDEGLVLAKRVDELRQMRLQLENNFESWRRETSKAIQIEIDTLVVERDDMAKQVIEARSVRDDLLKPLNEEWAIVNKEKELIANAKNEIFLDQERLDAESIRVKLEAGKISKDLVKLSVLIDETDAYKQETLSLKEQAESIYKVAYESREKQNNDHERLMAEATKMQREYEVSLSIIEIREKQVEERDSELSIRENDLTRRIKNLQRVEGK